MGSTTDQREGAGEDWKERHARLAAAVERHMVRYVDEFFPFFVERGEGSYVYDESGRKILDFTSGQMCATLGHNHPAVVAAVERSGKRVMHLLSWMLAPEVVDLCRELAGLLPPTLQKVLLLNTGSESNEAALRMARMASGRFEVVGFDNSYHGLTAGAGSITYSRPRRGYGPGLPGTMSIPAPHAYRCPIRHCRDACDMTCLEVGFERVDKESVGSLAAFIAEPVISSGGMVVPPPGYFPRVKELCEARGMLLVLDEAQTGLGRVGANFAFEQDGAVPDILTLSKTLGGGLPLAATVTGDDIEGACFDAGFSHLTSHVSDPLPAAVGLAVLEVLARDGLAKRSARLGGRLEAGLRDLMQRYEVIGDVRGRGLMWGVEIVKDRKSREADPALGARIASRALDLGLSMNITAYASMAAIWRIAPPLTIAETDLDLGLDIIDQAIRETLADGGGA